jgi:hypothetical protein
MSFGEVSLGFFGLLLLISHSGRLEHLICETLESVTVLDLVLSLGVENVDVIQEAFKFARSGLVLLVALQPFHCVNNMIYFPLFVMALGRARLVRVARLLLLLLLSGVQSCLLRHGVFVGDVQHIF